MKKPEALRCLDRLLNSNNEFIRNQAYKKLKELIEVLLPES